MLAKALDERTPLLERAKFFAIFTSNLDEFMKRQTVIHHGTSDAQRALAKQVRERLLPLLERQAECYRKVIVRRLAEHRIFLRYWSELTPSQREEASKFFGSQVSPALTPLVIDPVHPFPFLSNLSTSLVFPLHDVVKGESMLARVKIPGALKSWISLEADLEAGQKLLVPLSEVIRGNLHKLYSAMEIGEIAIMRLTRDAEVALDEDFPADFRAQVKEEIRQRRYEPVVRLEFGAGVDPTLRETLRDRFNLTEADLYDLQEAVDYTTLFELLRSSQT